MAKVFTICRGSSDSENPLFQQASITVHSGGGSMFRSTGEEYTLPITDREALELLAEALEDGFDVEAESR